ncbi:hypothetical protein A0256_10575 [Mucilaginibacter sp. PAMC 26640]|nr:hypothetical protein A0256_10575 [Mucilaginibacter sp. PAMC 26640]
MINNLVSVIMPAYNAEDFIAAAIDSVIDQTYKNWELLIINDGSTDSTAAIVDDYQKKHARIKVIHQANKKLGAARNAGITAATGQWLAFLDADDTWLPQKLELQLQLAAAKPNIGLIFTDGIIFYNNTEEIASYDIMYGAFSAAEMYTLLYKGNCIPVLSVLVKAEHVKAVGLQDENPLIYGCEDWDYWLRLCLHNVAFYGMHEKLFRYRKHLSNMSNNNDMMQFAKANLLLKNFIRDKLNAPDIAALKSFINITICQFIRRSKITEAQILNSCMAEVFATPLRELSKVLIDTLKRQSYYLLRPVFKLEKLLYQPDGNA